MDLSLITAILLIVLVSNLSTFWYATYDWSETDSMYFRYITAWMQPKIDSVSAHLSLARQRQQQPFALSTVDLLAIHQLFEVAVGAADSAGIAGSRKLLLSTSPVKGLPSHRLNGYGSWAPPLVELEGQMEQSPAPFWFVYNMGRQCMGPLLEQAETVSSTIAWTLGLRDGEQIDNRRRQPFFKFCEKHKHCGSPVNNSLAEFVHIAIGRAYAQLPYKCAFFAPSNESNIAELVSSWVETVKSAQGNRQIFAFNALRRVDPMLEGDTTIDMFGCKAILGKIFNISHETQTEDVWAIEVHGLHSDWGQTLNYIIHQVETSRAGRTAACAELCEGFRRHLPGNEQTRACLGPY